MIKTGLTYPPEVARSGDVMVIKGGGQSAQSDFGDFKLEELRKFLVISEDVEKSRKITEMLESFNPECSVFESGVEALNNCRRSLFNMILCDYKTKYLSGWNFVKEFKNNIEIQNMPVILFSEDKDLVAKDSKEKAQLIDEYGIRSILVYPFTKTDLKNAVEQTRKNYETKGTIENLYTKAKESFIAEEHKVSKKIFQAIHKAKPQQARSNLAMSNVYKKEGDTKAMSAHLDKAVSADKENMSARYMQFEMALDGDSAKSHMEVASQLVKDAGENKSAVLFNLSNILFKHKQHDDTLDLIIDSYETLDDIPEYIRLMEIKTYVLQNKIDTAWEIIQDLLRKKYENVELCNLAAIVSRKRNDIKGAIGFYLQALDKSPSDYKIMYNLALAYRQMKEYKKALEYTKLIKKIEPGFTKADQLLAALTAAGKGK